MKNFNFFAFFAFFAVIISLSGCNSDSSDTVIELDRPPNLWERAYKQEGELYLDGRLEDYSARERKLAEYFEALADVESAAVTIDGNSAVISLDMHGSPSGEQVKSIKHAVTRQALDLDESLEKVSVNCGPELYNRTADKFIYERKQNKPEIPPEKKYIFPAVPSF